MTEPDPDAGSLYEQLAGELLIDPQRLAAEITAGLAELRQWDPTTIPVTTMPPVTADVDTAEEAT